MTSSLLTAGSGKPSLSKEGMRDRRCGPRAEFVLKENGETTIIGARCRSVYGFIRLNGEEMVRTHPARRGEKIDKTYYEERDWRRAAKDGPCQTPFYRLSKTKGASKRRGRKWFSRKDLETGNRDKERRDQNTGKRFPHHAAAGFTMLVHREVSQETQNENK